ncbi:hypothetical protein U9M48_019295, partial [Paspalum notatum var. saurae]
VDAASAYAWVAAAAGPPPPPPPPGRRLHLGQLRLRLRLGHHRCWVTLPLLGRLRQDAASAWVAFASAWITFAWVASAAGRRCRVLKPPPHLGCRRLVSVYVLMMSDSNSSDNECVSDSSDDFMVTVIALECMGPNDSNTHSIPRPIHVMTGIQWIKNKFGHSLETVSRKFTEILESITRMAHDVVRPKDAEFGTVHPRLQEARFWPHFKDCIGAIDGTHIPVTVSASEQPKYTGRHGYPTQNVMAVCDFDMRFTFVVTGWPGSVHDTRILLDTNVLSRGLWNILTEKGFLHHTRDKDITFQNGNMDTNHKD